MYPLFPILRRGNALNVGRKSTSDTGYAFIARILSGGTWGTGSVKAAGIPTRKQRKRVTGAMSFQDNTGAPTV